jgi:hypothetical protein
MKNKKQKIINIQSAEPFSTKLTTLLSKKGELYISYLENTFQEKSFAVAFILLMALPALPIPTGGISHVFEIITMLLALEIMVGRNTIWLPNRFKKVGFNESLKAKVLPFIIKRIIFLERFSRPRAGHLFRSHRFRQFLGMPILVLTVLAFLVPPFSGLDTLFAMGVVSIALSI